MPELPEVEIIRRGIEPYVVGHRIVKAVIRNSQLRWPIPEKLEKVLPGLTINAVKRRAKYLLLDCGDGTLMIHLGMSGSLRLLTAQSSPQTLLPEKHDHFDLILDNKSILRLRDPRRLGAVLWDTGDIQHHPLLVNLGVEPLSDAFNAKMLYNKTRGLRVSIKALLMNNRLVVGLGNIYTNEALFCAGINPKTAAGKIGIGRYQKLVRAVKQVLRKAIEAGGSSLRDFVNMNGEPGYFQQQYWVYGRAGLPCRRCGTIIQKIKQGQRSTFYCPSCQR